MKEREISLVDLLIEMFLHWRMAILLMLVGCICFSGVSYIKSLQNVEPQIEQPQTEEKPKSLSQKLEEALDESKDLEDIFQEHLRDTQRTNVKLAINYENIYRDKLAYGDNSIIMKINPQEVSKIQILFWVKSDSLENTYNIENAYETLVIGNGLYEYLDSKHKIDASAVRELVKLDNESYGKDIDTSMFQMTILHYNEKKCDELAKAIVDYVEYLQQELQGKLGEHEVVVLKQVSTTMEDNNILNQQRAYINELLANMSTSAWAKEALSVEEKLYYDYLTGDMFDDNYDFPEPIMENIPEDDSTADGGEEESQTASANSSSFNIKYSILGLILFAFIYAFILFLRYVLDSKIKYTDNLHTLYGIPQLGQIPKTKVRKPFAFVDDWLYGLRDRGKRRFPLEETINLTIATVKIAIRQSNIKTISLIGCDIKQTTLSLCEKIKQSLEEDGINVEILNNILYDVQNMERLTGVEGVVLVETAASTAYDEIFREIDLMQRQNILVLGGIIQE